MSLSVAKTYSRAAGLGVIAGMRSMYAPAVLSHIYSRHPSPSIENSPLKFIQAMPTSKVFKVLAAGELIGDKLPFAPDRIATPGLTGRILFGALCGATVFKGENRNVVIGGLVGGLAALGSTFGCFFLRKSIGSKNKIADPVVGVCEDAITVAAGIAIVKNL
ncbi:DUF4126 family protein [Mucilaginibacter achroorhodeus]|uniref:DUF4126 family protein n=1 Tax=Mucilaginibacter achroorhodeus TaxID=2599294 RepID=A0A563U495_9SPHI|nr:DUF4126 family protein [Mucilaginibacter achroorhodeus]TWR26161.1 DUF4126 family protein [Mucilaginibacter achroorhodeus]